MKINEASKDFYVLTMDREEVEFVAAVLEDHAVDLMVKYVDEDDNWTTPEYEPVSDRCWKLSVDMDEALKES